MTMLDMLTPSPEGRGDRSVLVDLVNAGVVRIIGFNCVAHDLDADCNQHGAWDDDLSMLRAAVAVLANPGCDVRLLGEPAGTPNESYVEAPR